MRIELRTVDWYRTPGHYAKEIEESGLTLTTCYEDGNYTVPSKYYIEIKTIEDLITLSNAVDEDIIFQKDNGGVLVIYDDYME